MNIDLWSFGDQFYLGLPLRPSGYFILALLLGGVIALGIGKGKPGLSQVGSSRRWILLIVLSGASLFTSGILWLRLPPTGSLVVPGVPQESQAPVMALLGSIPWLLAAGLLGRREAILVGLVGGVARGGWQTSSILTPASIALVAGLVAWMLQCDYAEWPGKLLRRPIVSSVVGGLLLGTLFGLERFAYSGGDPYDGLEYAIASLGPILLATVLEAAIAGSAAEALRFAWPNHWHRPKRLITGPYQRSLAARLVTVFVLLGVAASGVIVYGDWLLARAAAKEMLGRELMQTAAQVGESIPFFVQTGRSLVREFADGLGPQLDQNQDLLAQLEDQMRLFPFFTRLAIFDQAGQLVAMGPEGTNGAVPGELELEAAVVLGLGGVPQEVVAPPEQGEEAAQLIFLAPVAGPGQEGQYGVVAAWADLASNPMIVPTIRSLAHLEPGEGFIIDGRGTILVHPDPLKTMTRVDLSQVPEGEVHTDVGPEGTRRLIYVHSVEGYPWRVVLTRPQRLVNSLAVRIAARLFMVLGFVGLALVIAVFGTSRRLTKPLGQMASVAESISHGRLDQLVEMVGEDEIGRLSSSFEDMRRSLKTRLEEMDLLLGVSQRLASSFDLRQIIPPILSGLQALTKADLVCLVQVPPGGEVPRHVDAFRVGKDPGYWVTLDAQVLRMCRERGRFVLENPNRARAVLNLEPLTIPIEGLAGLPILNGEEFVGALWLGYKQPHPIRPDELDLLSIVSGQLGASVANARLFHLAEQERMRLGAVLDATPDAVIVTDRSGRISLANPAAEVVLRGKSHMARGKPAVDWLTAPQLVGLLLLPGEEIRSAEVNLGDGRVLFASARDVHGAADEAIGRVCVLSDITHYKKLDTLKSEFVATVSHDLRAPLALMRGYVTVLSMIGAMNEQQKDFVRKILDSIDQMKHLVDELLDLGRIEAGVGLNLEQVKVEEIIQEVVESNRPRAVNKQIDMKVSLEEDMLPIEADATLLRQALTNLLDNAIKYTPHGGRVSVSAHQAGGRQLIGIRDTGLGIAPADQVRLFEKFYRAGRSDTPRERGYGLGLSIAKSIVEQHGGKIEVESQLGAGSTFVLDLPLTQADREGSPQDLTAGQGSL